MTVVKGNFGGDGQGAPTLDNIDLTHAKTMECEECQCKGFKQSMMLKKLSPLISPTGQEAMVPVAVFACEKCQGVGFKQTMMLKKLSPLVSPNGQEAIIPVGAFACESCGHVNKEFQEADIKQA